jgi:tetratricopeptide (TPR) repeat protein
MNKESTLQLLERRVEYLERQEAITADPALQFQLREQIRETKDRIKELQGGDEGQPVARHMPLHKGLRSYDRHDAKRFLELLPGQRDASGLPESVISWKRLIQYATLDESFAVALVQGPIGSGKSSLFAAGVLPNLSDSVRSIVIETHESETHERLAQKLHAAMPGLPHNLEEAIDQLARAANSTDSITLLVLDQFERWLQSTRDYHTDNVVRALQRCDGHGVKCILIVRDDFATRAYRLFQHLQITLVQYRTWFPIDLFDKTHARHVLFDFGKGYQRFDNASNNPTDEQLTFLNQAVDRLANKDDGLVLPVRLSLFVDIIKHDKWTPALLTEFGSSSEGIGVRFLRHAFDERDANPRHRHYRKAAHAFLKALVLDGPTGALGSTRSRAELMTVTGCTADTFGELLEILDTELRLISPTDEDDTLTNVGLDTSPEGEGLYKLAHDYMVQPVRLWLTERDGKSFFGRARLLLRERTDVWSNSGFKAEELPRVRQVLTILAGTLYRDSSTTSRKMVTRASCGRGWRRILLFSLCGLPLLGLAGTQLVFVVWLGVLADTWDVRGPALLYYVNIQGLFAVCLLLMSLLPSQQALQYALWITWRLSWPRWLRPGVVAIAGGSWLAACSAVLLIPRVSATAVHCIANVAKLQNKLDDSLQLHTNALSIYAADPNIWLGRSQLRWQMGQKSTAITDLSEAIRLVQNGAGSSDDLAGLRMMRAQCHVELKQLDQALADLDDCVRLTPTASPVHYNRGLACWALGRLSDAERSLAHVREDAQEFYDCSLLCRVILLHRLSNTQRDEVTAIAKELTERAQGPWVNYGRILTGVEGSASYPESDRDDERFWNEFVRAQAELIHGDPKAARTHFEACRQLHVNGAVHRAIVDWELNSLDGGGK